MIPWVAGGLSYATLGGLSYSPVPWAGISPVFHGYFTGISRPREPSPRKYFHASDHLHESILAGMVRGDNLRGRIISLLLYILVPVPVKYPPMELRELHTRGRGRGRVSPVPIPVKYLLMELGGYATFGHYHSERWTV